MNNQLASILEELSIGEQSLGKVFQAKAYKNAAEAILLAPNINDINEIKSIKGIGTKIFQKLKTYIETGTFPLLEQLRNNPILNFTKIYGIGHKKAKELVEKHNITTIEELRENTDLLNSKQRIGLEYLEDINTRIPRTEIAKHEEYIRSIMPSGLIMEVVGSYRRGAKTSGDIDIIFSHENTKTGSALFKTLIERLEETDYITHMLAKGSKKSMFLAKLENYDIHRRIDFLFTPFDEYPFAILYFTGSKYFNIHMRRHALDMGYSINEQRMKDMKTKKNVDVNEANIKTEKDIFKFLRLKYIQPSKRIGGKDIITLNNKHL